MSLFALGGRDGHVIGRSDVTKPYASGSAGASELGRAAVTLLGSVIGAGLGILGEVLSARILGLEGYGFYSMAVSVARIGETFALLGLSLAVLRFVPLYQARQQRGLVVGTVLLAMISPLLVGAALSVVLRRLSPSLSVYLSGSEDLVRVLDQFAVMIPLMAFTEITGAITRGFGFATYYVITRNVSLPLVFCLALLAEHADGLASVASAFFMAYAVASVVGLGSVLYVLVKTKCVVMPRYEVSVLYSYSLSVFANSVLYTLIEWSNVVLIGAYLGAAQAGLYRGAVRLLVVFDMLIVAFNTAVAHLFPTLELEGRRAELEHTYRTVTRWVVAVSVPLFVLVWINAETLLLVFGPGFTAGVAVVRVLALAQLVKASTATAGFLLTLVGLTRYELLIGATTLALSTALLVSMVERLGVVSGAAAFLVGMLAMGFMRSLAVARLLRVRPSGWDLGMSSVSGVVWILVASIASVLLRATSQPTGIVVRNLIAMSGLIVFGWRCVLTDEDRALLRNVARHVRWTPAPRNVALLLAPLAAVALACTPVTTPPPPMSAAPARYLIGNGDRLSIRLFYAPELNEDVVVRPDGGISLPLVGDIEAAGRSPAELSQQLRERYADHVSRPDVVVIVREPVSSRAFVGGEVRSPSVLPVDGSLTVGDAIILAGGALDSAELKSVILVRREGQTNQCFRLDVEDAYESGAPLPRLEPNDVVYVPKSQIAEVNKFVDLYINRIIPRNTGFQALYNVNPQTVVEP
jgi:O-antigen/teichoic acid export membrane protein/protein involved in polysaccharide export with SLBB domain